MKRSSALTYLPSLISGCILVLCFPHFKTGILAFVALVPFMVSLYGLGKRKAFVSGFIMGLPYFFGTNYWVYHSISTYGGMNIITSLVLVFILSAYLSLYTGLFAVIFSSRINNTCVSATLIAPLVWVVLEFLRSYLLTGYPYSHIGYTQYEFLKLIQISDITGVYGVSYIVVAINGAIADFFIMKKRKAEKPLFDLSPTITGYAIISVLIIGSLIYGSDKLNTPIAGNKYNVTIIQPNIDQNIKWDNKYQSEVLDTLETMTLNNMVNSAPDIVIWPETALPYIYNVNDPLTKRLKTFVKNMSIPLLTGAITVEDRNIRPVNLSNSAVYINAKGKESSTYNKMHLVPFGEYVPLNNYFNGIIEKLVYGIGNYKPGHIHVLSGLNNNKFATIICYEVAFPGLVRNFFKKDGDFLVTITNDAWFGKTTGPYHHLAMSVFRSVENRKPSLRAANTGVSAVIDSNGRIIEKTDIFKRTVINHTFITDSRKSIYSRYGDLFIYFCIIITIILIADIRRKH